MFTGMAIGAAAWGWGWHGGYNVTVNNVYNHWGRGTVSTYHGNYNYARGRDAAVVRGGDDTYAARDGNVYRKQAGEWQRYNRNSGSWDNMNRLESRINKAQTQRTSGDSFQSLDRDSSARSAGDQSFSQFRSNGGFGDHSFSGGDFASRFGGRRLRRWRPVVRQFQRVPRWRFRRVRRRVSAVAALAASAARERSSNHATCASNRGARRYANCGGLPDAGRDAGKRSGDRERGRGAARTVRPELSAGDDLASSRATCCSRSCGAARNVLSTRSVSQAASGGPPTSSCARSDPQAALRTRSGAGTAARPRHLPGCRKADSGTARIADMVRTLGHTSIRKRKSRWTATATA